MKRQTGGDHSTQGFGYQTAELGTSARGTGEPWEDWEQERGRVIAGALCSLD